MYANAHRHAGSAAPPRSQPATKASWCACEYGLSSWRAFTNPPYTRRATRTKTARFTHTFVDDRPVDDELVTFTSGGEGTYAGGKGGGQAGRGANPPAPPSWLGTEAVALGATRSDRHFGHLIEASEASAPHW